MDVIDVAIRVAARWYSSHLAPYGIRVFLLTNDQLNRKAAENAGIDTMSSASLSYLSRSDMNVPQSN